MRICVIGGAGYVGLVTGVGLAEAGHSVINVDVDLTRIMQLKSGTAPIQEPGLEVMLKRNLASGRLSFETEASDAVKSSELVFITVGTPLGQDGRADISDLTQVIGDLSPWLHEYKVLAIRSTVPTGVLELIRTCLSQDRQEGRDFDIVVNPEFLREGKGIQDFLGPDRIVIGTTSDRAKRVMRKAYGPIVNRDITLDRCAEGFATSDQSSRSVTKTVPLLETDELSAQMIKYASNAFLAARVSFVNELAGLCETVGADVTEVTKGIGYDPRIGHGYLEAGLGFGGPCLEKDLRALIGFAGDNGHDPFMLRAVLERNQRQIEEFVKKLEVILGEDLSEKTITAFGLTFKAGTNDTRNSLAVKVVESLVRRGAHIQVYDPAVESDDIVLDPKVTLFTDAYDAASNADALVILTEWPCFVDLDYAQIKECMVSPCVLDGCNLLDPKLLREKGFSYKGVGRV